MSEICPVLSLWLCKIAINAYEQWLMVPLNWDRNAEKSEQTINFIVVTVLSPS